MPCDFRRPLKSPAARSCVEVQLSDQFTATTDEIEWWLYRDDCAVPVSDRASRRNLSLQDCNVEGNLQRLLRNLKEVPFISNRTPGGTVSNGGGCLIF